VLLTAFHHGGIWHLFFNSCAIWYCGGLLESRLGSLRFALLVLGSIAVSGLAESYFEPYVGLSGLGYALFGMLMVLRRYDEEVAQSFDNQMVWTGMLWLFACVPLTYLHVLPVGNLAHFSGLIYGWVAGQVLYGDWRSKWLGSSFVAAHLLLVPGFYLAVHPFWNGGYHWRMADLAGERGDEDEVMRQSRLAVACDPRLTGPWYKMAVIQWRRGELLPAWETMLHGIFYNPAYQDGISLARTLWMQLHSEAERDEARQILRQVFLGEAPKWDDKLIAQIEVDGTETAPRPGSQIGPPMPPNFAPLPIRALDEPTNRRSRLPAPDPDKPGSAEEGRTT
jgi:hypothetical protein